MGVVCGRGGEIRAAHVTEPARGGAGARVRCECRPGDGWQAAFVLAVAACSAGLPAVAVAQGGEAADRAALAATAGMLAVAGLVIAALRLL